MKIKQITIIGGGHGGIAEAGVLAEKGFMVNIYNRSIKNVEYFNKTKKVVFNGYIKGVGKINLVTNNIKKAIKGSKIIFIILPATAHRSVILLIKKHLEDGQILVLLPGKLGGSMVAWEIIKSANKNISIFESESVIIGARRKNKNNVQIYGIKREVKIGGIHTNLNKARVKEDYKILKDIHKEFCLVSNPFEASFSEVGCILHPAITIFNSSRIENKENFLFYINGISKSIVKVMSELDKERILIAKNYNIKAESTKIRTKKYYNAKGKNLHEILHNTYTYKDVYGPISIGNRFIKEDVGVSLVLYREFAQKAGICTPMIDSVIYLSRTIFGLNKKNERHLSELGLDKMNFNKIKSTIKLLTISI